MRSKRAVADLPGGVLNNGRRVLRNFVEPWKHFFKMVEAPLPSSSSLDS